MAKYKDNSGKEHDDKDLIPAGAAVLRGTYMCAYCYALLKFTSSDGQLPTCPKCGWDKWIR